MSSLECQKSRPVCGPACGKVSLDTSSERDHPGSLEREDMIGLSRLELSQRLEALGERSFRARQVWQWLYNRGGRNIQDMTNLSRETRTRLEAVFYISRPTMTQQHISEDGTCKWLFKFNDTNEAETVYIPETERGSVCISTQVGCTLTCRFCHTGTQPLVRNLSASEIVGQFLAHHLWVIQPV